MDIFVNEELKRYLFPLFEDNAPAEKLRVLQEEYPVLKLTPEQVLKAILNRSRNELSDYTKLVALSSYPELAQPEITADIVSHLFNPDINIAETAAWINYKIIATIHLINTYCVLIIASGKNLVKELQSLKNMINRDCLYPFVRFLQQTGAFIRIIR